SPLFGPLQASPLDLLATALVALALSMSLLEWTLANAPDGPRPVRALPALLLAILLLAGTTAWIADVSGHAPVDLDSIALVPRTAVHATIHVALLAILATALVLTTALFVLAGPLPPRLLPRMLLLGVLAALLAARFVRL